MPISLKGGLNVYKLPPTERQRRSIVAAAQFLSTRTAASDNRHALGLLRPGMSVLDVGCATGTITHGLAAAVAPTGYAVGTDINTALVLEAAARHADVPNLSFVPSDVYSLPYEDHFDVVTSARTLQWCRQPVAALERCRIAAKPGGIVVILDYNHEKVRWSPALPASVNKFWSAYLQWRRDEAFDPTVADSLERLMKEIGLEHVTVIPQHEHFIRGQDNYKNNIELWRIVMDKRGDQLVRSGYLRAGIFREALADFDRWATHFAQEIIMYALAVEGRRPSA